MKLKIVNKKFKPPPLHFSRGVDNDTYVFTGVYVLSCFIVLCQLFIMFAFYLKHRWRQDLRRTNLFGNKNFWWLNNNARVDDANEAMAKDSKGQKRKRMQVLLFLITHLPSVFINHITGRDY